MNCKQGDLAIVVGAKHDMSIVGWVVRVVRRAPQGTVLYGGKYQGQQAVGSDCWVVEASDLEWIHSDSRLRPIRGKKGEDEILRIAGYPEKVAA